MLFHDLNEKLQESKVGGKAYHLSRMMGLGLSVPEGFVLSSEAYERRLEFASFRGEIAARAALIHSPYVMVRSSAIGEDAQEGSFAGQLDSFIVKNNPEDLFHAVLNCWKSLEGTRVEAYGKQSGRKLERMGVVIQKMIQPDFAGVYFTASPGNPKQALLEYVEGHAEKLVSGQVTPRSHSFTPGQAPAEIPFVFDRLAEQAEKIVRSYGRPQDIEWAAKGSEVFIVQTRPITLQMRPLTWSNTNVNENYPDELSPFLSSLARESYYHYFKNLAVKLGGYTPRMETELRGIIGTWGWRMYYNMSNIHSVLELSPFAGLFRKSFDDFVGYIEEGSLSTRFSALWKKVTFTLRLIGHFILLENKVQWMEAAVDETAEEAARAHDLKSLSDAYHQFLNLRFHEWHRASFADLFAMITHGALGRICQKIEGENYAGLQNQLIQSIPGLVSNQPIFEIHSIHLLLQFNPELKRIFQLPSQEVLEWIEAHPESQVSKAIHSYLSNWGFRCSGELTFSRPNYIDEPARFIDVLKAYAGTTPEDPRALFERKRFEQAWLLDESAHKAPFYLSWVLRALVRLTTYSISCRERVRLKQAKLYYAAKTILLEIGKRATSKGVLSKAEDILLLEYAEVSRFVSGDEIDPILLQELICARRESLGRAKAAAPEFESVHGEFKNVQIVAAPETEGALKGLSACGGEVEGVVRILESVHEISRIQKGEILVTRQTDPGWICAFPMISGLIVERGGMLSHGAIVAREFGIPAIVAVDRVTSVLKDGQRIRLNANQGTITCLD